MTAAFIAPDVRHLEPECSGYVGPPTVRALRLQLHCSRRSYRGGSLDPPPTRLKTENATSEPIRRSYGHPRGEPRPRSSVASRFFSSFFSQDIFARTLRALCITETCMNEDQLKSMLSGQNAAAGTPAMKVEPEHRAAHPQRRAPLQTPPRLPRRLRKKQPPAPQHREEPKRRRCYARRRKR